MTLESKRGTNRIIVNFMITDYFVFGKVCIMANITVYS